ncbi:hypothetical protein VTK26DRAFT_9287 [Humicola hyalothermophila]
MDDATRLVSELHKKLAELDSKVSAYQRDMLAEFHKHVEDCLKKYPDHVSNEVLRAIAESMSAGRYPALIPAARDAPELRQINHGAWDGRKSPPPILPHTSGTPKESPRSPHAREREFHGVFTPTYLPLLDGSDLYRSPPTSPSASAGAESFPLSVAKMTEVHVTRHEDRPDPSRRLTNQSTSSVDSTGSGAKMRRSALRRSSSSNKGSPRRVRFDFQGEEVFPSASSPNASPTLTPESGAEPQPKADPSATASSVETESTEYLGPSLLDVEGEEDWLPRPKKVSSTQALQALTRSPLEDGTVWTVVNPDPEEPVEMNGEKQAESAAGPPSLKVDSMANLRSGNSTGVEEEPSKTELLGSPIEELGNYDDEDGNGSEEECLSMKPKRKTPSPVAKSPFPAPAAQASATVAANASANGKPAAADDDDHDPFFDLEEEALTPQQKYIPDSEDDDPDHQTGISANRLRSLAKAEGASPSPAKDSEDEEEEEEEEEGENEAQPPYKSRRVPPVSPSAALFNHSVGSYMGRSITVEPIRDPKLYDEIANMKGVHFSVGSVDGRSGADPADMGSYRAANLARDLLAAGATPKSLSQRLALEEEMERRRVLRGETVDEEE